MITASFTFHGRKHENIPVINPGDWFGKTWLIAINYGHDSLLLIAEADTMANAIDELADSKEHGHLILVSDPDLADYDPENCEYGPSGQVIDTSDVLIHGVEGKAIPFSCMYHGKNLPESGICPTAFCWNDLDNRSKMSDTISVK